MTAINWPHLFDKSLVDVSDVAGQVGKQLGGWHENVLDVVVVNKKWKALPWGNIGQLEAYRTDWFKEVGVTKFPDTCEDLLASGRLLKKKGHSFGFELGHDRDGREAASRADAPADTPRRSHGDTTTPRRITPLVFTLDRPVAWGGEDAT